MAAVPLLQRVPAPPVKILPPSKWVYRERSSRCRCGSSDFQAEHANLDNRVLRRNTSISIALGLLSLALPPLSLADDESPRQPRRVRSPLDEERLLEQNRRMQKLNNAPSNFPGFIREGYNVKVVVSGQDWVNAPSGLIYLDIEQGEGRQPKDGQQVVFHYTGYNESGHRVDSSYQQGTPARTRLGINGMIPGFEEGLRTMRAGGKRRIVVPPQLGPPVGPSTFFSAKQFEVFDVELLAVQDCTRRTIAFYSDVVCQDN